jgi:HEAT repeat protein
MNATESAARRQTYTLNGKNPYVRPGDQFRREVSILAGAPSELADLSAFSRRTYDPFGALRDENPVDRYAAVKTLPHRDDLHGQAVAGLEELLATESDERVALEAAGSVAALGLALGQEYIGQVLWGDSRRDIRMEAVLILTELSGPFARAELVRVAAGQHFEGEEIRQAAVWGLGKTGLKAYQELLPFISDPDENVALHAIVSFGTDTPEAVVRALLRELTGADPRRAPAASETLRLIANETVLRVLVEAAGGNHDWVLATLGRLPPALVRPAITGSALMEKLAPLLLLSEGTNWLATEDRVMDIAFLTKQNL